MNSSSKRVVDTGYDRVAERYLASKAFPPDAAVLDLGCGVGVPVTRWLTQRFAVTGVDICARQLKLARQHVPAAKFLKADMTDLSFAPETFEAVVALHSIIHVPRAEHPALAGKIHSWLKPGGETRWVFPGDVDARRVGRRRERLGGLGLTDAAEPPRRRDESGAAARRRLRNRARRSPHHRRHPR